MKLFSGLHPIALIVFFSVVIGISMFTMNPILSITAIAGGLIFKFMLVKDLSFIKEILCYLIIGLVVTITNPIFSHNGKTVLFFVNDTPVTKESIIYGGCAALMLISVLCWFSCFSYVMTSDKIIYLFSGIAPVLGLVISSSLKFVPAMKKKYHEIYSVQKNLINENSKNLSKLLLAVKSFSSLVTWAIEHTADTSSSMSSRGYGLKNRTSFNLFRFRFNDCVIIFFGAASFIYFIFMIRYENINFIFYPEIIYPKKNIGYLIFCIIWLSIVLMPAFTEIKGEVKWKLLRSGI